MSPPLYIGLMSGTSLDGVDAVLVEINDSIITHRAAITLPMPDPLRQEILALITSSKTIDLQRLGVLDVQLGELFATAVLDLLSQSNCRATSVCAIGSHGQTLWHQPSHENPFTLQIGDPNRIAERTGITTVADFRRRDMAAGGQGAPLVPAYHHAHLRASSETRVILNLGGMANITLLPSTPDAPTTGFDTGPGNVLMDLHARIHMDCHFDKAGAWAASGCVDAQLLGDMLADPYFTAPPPKSTGREHFNEAWLLTHTHRHPSLPAADIQATLAELTARSIRDAVYAYGPDCARVLVCGGGVHNQHLMVRLKQLMAPITVESTASHGVEPDWVEATAFAWLADRTLRGLPGNLPTVTGARHPVILGGIYPASL